MPIVKLQFKPGINTELTNYANEGGWINCDKTRFRSGYPEKLGGWVNYSPNYTFVGAARSMYCYVDYSNNNLLGIGTNQKFYIENGGQYYDITPVGYTTTVQNPFATVLGYNLVTVTDLNFDSTVGTFVTFSNSTTFNGINFNGSFEIISTPTATSYTIIAPTSATGTGSGGGNNITASYQINAGNAVYTTGSGYGVAGYGLGGYGSSTTVGIPLQLWSQFNNNNDMMMAYRNGPIYYWTNSVGTYSPAIPLTTYIPTNIKTSMTATFNAGFSTLTVTNPLQIDIGAIVTGVGIPAGTYVTTAYTGGTTVTLSQTTTSPSSGTYNFSYSGLTAPLETLQLVNSNTFGFIIAMGSTPYNPQNFTPTFNPLLVRWSDQSNAAEWTQTVYNQAGQQYLSSGSYIMGSISTRQETLIWTDTTLYSMQYIGPPYTFGFTVLMDNISVISPNCMVSIGGITYWMGNDKFYIYSGTVATLPSTVRKYIFGNINVSQTYQIVAGFNERFNEIWWLYPSVNSNINDSYVIYNYLENLWYYGTLNRTCWLDSGLRPYPMAIYSNQNTYLSMSLSSTATTMNVYNSFSMPSSGTVVVGSENISYTGNTGTALTGLTRGVNNTVASAAVANLAVTNLIPNQVVYHEDGVDDQTYPAVLGPQAINSYITSSDFSIGDGHHYAFVWRMLPDFAFTGSTAPAPQITVTVEPRQNSGTAYQSNPAIDQPTVTNSSTYPIQLFTGEVWTRIRGRQAAFQINSANQGVFWQMGSMRFDIRQDGRR